MGNRRLFASSLPRVSPRLEPPLPDEKFAPILKKGDLHLFYRRNKGVGRLVVSETPEQSRFSKSQFMESTDGEQLEERTFKSRWFSILTRRVVIVSTVGTRERAVVNKS